MYNQDRLLQMAGHTRSRLEEAGEDSLALALPQFSMEAVDVDLVARQEHPEGLLQWGRVRSGSPLPQKRPFFRWGGGACGDFLGKGRSVTGNQEVIWPAIDPCSNPRQSYFLCVCFFVCKIRSRMRAKNLRIYMRAYACTPVFTGRGGAFYPITCLHNPYSNLNK